MAMSPRSGPSDKPFLRVVGSGAECEEDSQNSGEADEVNELIKLVGNRVKDTRKAQRLSRRVLSEKSGVSTRYLAKLEGGDGNISIGLLKKVALALNAPVENFLTAEDPQAGEIRQVTELYRRADAATRARVLQALDPERMRVQKAQRLCLVGLRGAGKTTLGARIGLEFQAKFIELNTEIEARAGMPVGEIIALYGHEGYRKLESDTLADIIQTHSRAVIAVAGGIVSEEDTFFRILSRFHTVWLKTSAAEHMERVRAQGDMRPMQGNPQAMIQLRQILKDRETFYAQADHVLDTSGKSVDASHVDLSKLVRSFNILDRNNT